jgi:hypothetical protein
MRPSPDWGDDFAQYLQEAENIAQGKPLEAGSYQFNPAFARIGPRVYPVGFPLILSLFSNESGKIGMPAAQLCICIMGVLLGLFVHLSLRQSGFKRWWALGCTTLYLYHPFFIGLKPDVLSDIPFAALFMATVFTFGQSKHWWQFILVGLLAGFTISTRSIGWVLPLGALALFGSALFQRKLPYNLLLFAAVAAVSGWIINFSTGYYDSAKEGYSLLFSGGGDFLENFNTNFRIYLETFEYYLTPFGNEKWHLVLLVMQHVFVGLFILGIARSLSIKIHFYAVCSLGYLLILLIYPYTGGFRFLLPIIPFLFIVIAKGAREIRPLWPLQKHMGIVALCLLALAYYPELSRLEREENLRVEGPQTAEARALFSWLEAIPNTESVLFLKPRAMAYYTKQSSFATEPNASPSSFEADVNHFNTRYLIEAHALPYPALAHYITEHPELILAYQNEGFKVWKKP